MFGLPDPRRLRRGLDAALASPPRRIRLLLAARRSGPVRSSRLFLTNASGYRVFVSVTEPDDDQPRPAVVLVPGRDKHSGAFDAGIYPITARELALRGLRAVAFDPVGRGHSWGHDDFCGSEGQDSLRAVLDFTHGRRDVLPERSGVASFSLGLCLAAPVLAEHGERLSCSFLLDWEGPTDRDAILRTGSLPPAARAALARDPEVFWRHREPLPFVEDLPCRYIRIQAREDHALGARGVAGALGLLAAAARGRAPCTRLNDNPANVAYRPEQAGGLRWASESLRLLSPFILNTLVALTAEESTP